MTLDGEHVASIVRWIGHDAAIFGGNSGGPLVNMDGQIVGVNEINMGLAGAIPGELRRRGGRCIDQGRASAAAAWIGLEIQPLLKSSPPTASRVCSAAASRIRRRRSPASSPATFCSRLDGRDVASAVCRTATPRSISGCHAARTREHRRRGCPCGTGRRRR